MALITFRCPACKLVLKISADKAGRKAKCRCGAELTIPLVSEDMATAAAPAPPAARSAAIDDDDAVTGYGLAPVQEPVEEKPQEKPKEKVVTPRDEEELERKRRRRAALRKAPMDPVCWERVRTGILLIMISTYLWIGAIILRQVLLGIGIAAGLQYASAADVPYLLPQANTPPGQEPELDKTSFVVALLAGTDSVDNGMTLLLIAQVLVALQGLAALAGYGICLSVPPRFGTYGMALTALCLAGLNLILQLVFKLLPLAGSMDYIMIPLVTPEISMMIANVGRLLPLQVYWSDAPFWEIIAALVIQLFYYAEPVIFCLFLRGAALSIRDDKLQARANAMILLALGTAFALVAYYLLAATGTSDVVGWVLRAVYMLWLAFLLGQLLWYTRVLWQARELIAAKLADEE
jgi:hypothetical protein